MIVRKGESGVARGEWEAYVSEHHDGTVFHLPGMYEAWRETVSYEPLVLFALNDNGEIRGLMLAVIQREPGKIMGYLSSRSVIFHGILADDNTTSSILLANYSKELKNRAIYTQVRNFLIPGDDLKAIYQKSGFDFEEHLNIRIDLTIPKAALWKGIKQNRKSGINKARKQDFQFKVVNDESIVRPFYDLLKQTYAVSGLPVPNISFFYSMNRHLGSQLRWFVLEHNGRAGIILAALLFKDILWIFYPGIDQDPSFLKLRPVDLFYYEVINWGHENGAKTLDWMGAGKPDKEYGVRYFKQQYGGTLYSPGRFVAVHRPLMMQVGKIGVRLLNIKARKR